MYDPKPSFFFVMQNMFDPKHKSANGKKDFWARGDGWIFAGLAKVLKYLPKDYKHRALFVKHYRVWRKPSSKLNKKVTGPAV